MHYIFYLACILFTFFLSFSSYQVGTWVEGERTQNILVESRARNTKACEEQKEAVKKEQGDMGKQATLTVFEATRPYWKLDKNGCYRSPVSIKENKPFSAGSLYLCPAKHTLKTGNLIFFESLEKL